MRITILLLALALLLGACGGAMERGQAHLTKAQQLFDEGDYQKARVEFRNVLQIEPTHVEAYLGLGRSLEQLHEWQRAARAYRQVNVLDPARVEGWVRLGRLYLLGSLTDEATKAAERALGLDPESVDAWLLQASIHLTLEQYASAFDAAEQVLSRSPESADGIALLSTLHWRTGEPEQALSLLEHGVTTNREHIGLRLLYADKLSARQLFAEAAVQVRLALRQQSTNIVLRKALGELYAKSGRVSDGRQVLESGYGLDPQPASVAALVDYLVEFVSFDAAESRLRELIDDNEDSAALRLTLAEFYDSNSRWPDAQATYKQLADMSDDKYRLIAMTRLARIYGVKGNTGQARRLVDDVLLESPSDPDALVLRGILAMTQNAPQEAIDDFRLVLRDHPTSVAVLRLKARAHLMNDETDQAKVALQKAIVLEPNDVATRIELVSVVERLNESTGGDTGTYADRLLAETKDVLDIRVTKQPNDVETLMLRGTVALYSKDHERAIDDFDAVLRLDPMATEASQLLARAKLLHDDLEGALQEATRAVESLPGDVAAKVLLAEVLEQGGLIESALEQLNGALEVNERSAPALESAARINASIGNWDAALHFANSLKEHHPGLSEGHYYAGLAYRGKGDTEASIKELQHAVSRSPTRVEPLSALARSYLQLNQPGEALAIVDDILKRDPTNVVALNVRGETLLSQGRLDEADAAFRRALELKPEWAVPHRNLGQLFASRGQEREAVEAWSSGLEKSRDKSVVSFELAQFYEDAGKIDQAIAQYETLLVESPDSVMALNNLAMLLVSYRQDDESLARAQKLAQRLETVTHPAMVDTVAWVYFKVGQFERAKVLLEGLVQDSPDVPIFEFHLGMVLHSIGELERAQHYLELALDNESAFQGDLEARQTLALLTKG